MFPDTNEISGKVAGGARFPDPLEPDHCGDQPVVTTRRGLVRLALVASETGARFEREAIPVDPMAWMLSPRQALGGTVPLDACLSLDACERALVVHRLALGLDVGPDVVGALLDDDDDDDDGEGAAADHDDRRDERDAAAAVRDERVVFLPVRLAADRSHVFAVPRSERPRLFTAVIVWSDGVEVLHAFHASIGVSAEEIRTRLADRFGAPSVERAEVAEGFRDDTAFVEAMVAPAVRDMLLLIAGDPTSPLAAGLDLNFEQRFLN